MGFYMKGAPFKQVKDNKASEKNNVTKKAEDKPKEKAVNDFTSEKTPVNNPFDTSNMDRTWKDLHWAEKGATINAGLIGLKIIRDLMKKGQ